MNEAQRLADERMLARQEDAHRKWFDAHMNATSGIAFSAGYEAGYGHGVEDKQRRLAEDKPTEATRIIDAAPIDPDSAKYVADVVLGAWCPVAGLAASGDPERLVLGYRADDGAMMIWRASMLLRNLKGPTPQHLTFAATHFRELPDPPTVAGTESKL